MERYIYFRSKKIHTHHSGDNENRKIGGGSDFSDIVTYLPGDDIRDISWNHSARTGIMKKKVRTEESVFPIKIINTVDKSCGFFTSECQISPYIYANQIIDILMQSAKKYHLPIEHIHDKQKLYGNQIYNNMIFCLVSGLEMEPIQKILKMNYQNDIIVIHIIHPYEYNPSSELLFDGYGLDIASYKKAYLQKINQIKANISKNKSAYLPITTNTAIIPCINNFFKNHIL